MARKARPPGIPSISDMADPIWKDPSPGLPSGRSPSDLLPKALIFNGSGAKVPVTGLGLKPVSTALDLNAITEASGVKTFGSKLKSSERPGLSIQQRQLENERVDRYVLAAFDDPSEEREFVEADYRLLDRAHRKLKNVVDLTYQNYPNLRAMSIFIAPIVKGHKIRCIPESRIGMVAPTGDFPLIVCSIRGGFLLSLHMGQTPLDVWMEYITEVVMLTRQGLKVDPNGEQPVIEEIIQLPDIQRMLDASNELLSLLERMTDEKLPSLLEVISDTDTYPLSLSPSILINL